MELLLLDFFLPPLDSIKTFKIPATTIERAPQIIYSGLLPVNYKKQKHKKQQGRSNKMKTTISNNISFILESKQ